MEGKGEGHGGRTQPASEGVGAGGRLGRAPGWRSEDRDGFGREGGADCGGGTGSGRAVEVGAATGRRSIEERKITRRARRRTWRHRQVPSRAGPNPSARRIRPQPSNGSP